MGVWLIIIMAILFQVRSSASRCAVRALARVGRRLEQLRQLAWGFHPSLARFALAVLLRMMNWTLRCFGLSYLKNLAVNRY